MTYNPGDLETRKKVAASVQRFPGLLITFTQKLYLYKSQFFKLLKQNLCFLYGNKIKRETCRRFWAKIQCKGLKCDDFQAPKWHITNTFIWMVGLLSHCVIKKSTWTLTLGRNQMNCHCQQQRQFLMRLSSSAKAHISRKYALEPHTKGPVKHLLSQLSQHTEELLWATCYTGALRLRTRQHCCTSQMTPGHVLSPRSMKCYYSSLKYWNFFFFLFCQKHSTLWNFSIAAQPRPLQESERALGQVSSAVTH